MHLRIPHGLRIHAPTYTTRLRYTCTYIYLTAYVYIHLRIPHGLRIHAPTYTTRLMYTCTYVYLTAYVYMHLRILHGLCIHAPTYISRFTYTCTYVYHTAYVYMHLRIPHFLYMLMTRRKFWSLIFVVSTTLDINCSCPSFLCLHYSFCRSVIYFYRSFKSSLLL